MMNTTKHTHTNHTHTQLDHGHVVEEILKLAVDILKAEQMTLYIVDASTTSLHVVFQAPQNDALLEQDPTANIRSEESLCLDENTIAGYVSTTGEAVISNNKSDTHVLCIPILDDKRSCLAVLHATRR